MIKFTPPNPAFLSEMVQSNVASHKTPLNFDHVPRSVLSKIVHHVTICSLLGEAPPKIDISVGPDEEYHHQIQGIASVTPQVASIFYQQESDWYSVILTVGQMADFELIVARLIDDQSGEWEPLTFAEDAETLQALSVDALAYLGLVN
ncbi:hypothetical protein KGP36_06980 [Patescibacteria group bacterium]|nr:hypothetical protein [Patescibacteria group bacterium]